MLKSKKQNAQHWYQVHKSRSGQSYVDSSKEVTDAKEKVNNLKKQLRELDRSDDTFVSGIRRLFFGRNEYEERAYQKKIELRDYELKLHKVEKEVREKGEKAYSADWISRNPDRAKIKK